MPNSYDYVTVMDGPDLEGLAKYWFGFYDEPVQRLSTNGVETVAEPVGHYELPRPMTCPEIEEWALDHLEVADAAIEEARARSSNEQDVTTDGPARSRL